MNEFEDLLLDLERNLTRSGHTIPLPELFELRMAAATAHELMAATERGDTTAAEFHAGLLEHHVRGAHALRFHVREHQDTTCTEREPD
ncbi:hypothetical protein [Lentzea sp.]|uniref:hypothetical protein n=1 Tax=Lentzea sp. TaxID=56099 RepID=UPI002B6AD032|nr:hypothetical protein [Lentzea sp.]HUQ57788.1 hypothetical protein [Lentzea sp.]